MSKGGVGALCWQGEVQKGHNKSLGIRAGRHLKIRGPCWMVRDLQEKQQGEQFHKLELSRALSLEEESSEHLRWTHLEQMQHCTDQPLQVTFPALPLIRKRRIPIRARKGQEADFRD